MRPAARLLAAVALVATAGCAPPARAPEPLVFWQSGPPEAIEPLVRRFEAENPALRVRVETVPRRAMPDSVALALAAGRPPDLCELDGTRMPALLASGALSDWSAGVADQRDSLNGWEACRVGDALYGMPWRVSPRVLLWNPALFARAGLDSSRAPVTWDELLAAATRLRRAGRGVHGYGMAAGDSGAVLPEFLTYAWSNGGSVLSAAADSSRFDSPRNVEALEFLARLGETARRDSTAGLAAEFAAGRLGLLVTDARVALRLARAAPPPGFRIAAVPAPAGATARPFGEACVLVSFTRSRHKEHALRLARFLVRPANAVDASALGAEGLPANAGADTLDWFRARPVDALLATEAGRARFARAHPAWGAMAGAIDEEVERALLGEKSAARAVADASARIAALAARR